jgi:hypothetical protein
MGPINTLSMIVASCLAIVLYLDYRAAGINTKMIIPAIILLLNLFVAISPALLGKVPFLV